MTVAQHETAHHTTDEMAAKIEAWEKLKAKQEKGEARKRKWRRALVVLGGLLALSCIAFCAFAFLAVGEAPATMPASTPVPTIQAVATQAVAPTQMPTPTLYVPAPTAIPMPTPVLTLVPVGENENEMEYLKVTTSLLERYSKAALAVSEMASQVEFDASGDFASWWKAEMTLAFAEVLFVGAEIREVQPPPRFEEAHSLLSEATAHADAGIFLWAEGIDSLDASLIGQAADELNLAAQLIEDYNEAIVPLLE